MMLDEDPSCTILIIGRYMAPVRAEYNSVRHLVRKAKLRPTIANNGHLQSVTSALPFLLCTMHSGRAST